MCGICGFYGFNDKNLLKRMAAAIAHRGSDDTGFFFDGSISIANNRLSIIDISGGHQPMSNETGSIWITYNGEIYNYRELREELEKKGHRFKSESDTEVIIHSYEEYGTGCLSTFNGMFAFAIWDSRSKTLFMARDRYGIKPLYYYYGRQGLIFASEIKAILCQEIAREVDEESLDLFMSFRYDSGPRTMFKGIKKLMPGHFAVLHNNRLRINRYYDLRFREEPVPQQSLHALMTDSVRKRLQSEVPVGVFLSGGVDSSYILALADKLNRRTTKTFSVGFNDSNDELGRAQVFSERFNTEHREIIVDSEAMQLLPKIVYHLDEPHADPTVVPTFFLSKLCKPHATVVLTGEGADELFAGYEQYKIMNLLESGKLFRPAARALYNNKHDGSILGRMVSAFSEQKASSRYLKVASVFSEQEKNSLLKRPVPSQPAVETVTAHFAKQHEHLSRMLYFDTKVLLPQLLMKLDKMAMAHTVETRVPYLDHRIVDFAASLDSRLKLKGLRDKIILRQSARELVGRHSLRAKRRFFPPLDAWFSKGIRQQCEVVLYDSQVMRYFRKHEIKKLLDYRSGWEYRILRFHPMARIYQARKLWNILVFGLWHKTYIQQDKSLLRQN